MDRKDNERLCQVGRDTEVGALLRRYWIPACLSSELPKPGGAPRRVRLLNDNLVAWRGANGKVGILDEHCLHRRASLVYARNENSTLRCLFHGWSFAADGRIAEMPNVDSSRMQDRLRARAYPVEESHGLVWTYLGPLDQPIPPRPTFAWESLPPEHSLIVPFELDCNWIQSFEGLIDSAHINFLHADVVGRMERKSHETDLNALSRNAAPRLELEFTDFGFQYAAIRENAGAAPDTAVARITAVAAPYLAFIPPGMQAFMVIPIDDTHCRFMNIWWSSTERLDSGPGYDHRIKRWGVSDEILRAAGMNTIMPGPDPMPPRNHVVQDRDAMESGRSQNGIPSLSLEDALMSISMGPIADRSEEHLVASDLAVVQFRRMLLDNAKLLAGGKDPIGIKTKTPISKIRATAGEMPNKADWREIAVPEHVVTSRTRETAI